MALIAHVAIVDDWESAVRFGEYEVSTLGVSLEEAGFVHAVELAGVRRVLDEHYAKIRYDLLLVILETDTLATYGLEFTEQLPGRFRVFGAIPTYGDAVVAVLPVGRDGGDFLLPDLSGFGPAAAPRGEPQQ